MRAIFIHIYRRLSTVRCTEIALHITVTHTHTHTHIYIYKQYTHTHIHIYKQYTHTHIYVYIYIQQYKNKEHITFSFSLI